MTRSRLLQLAAPCPDCKRLPKEWITPQERARWRDEDPGRLVRRIHCDHPRCKTDYWVSAKAYQEAA